MLTPRAVQTAEDFNRFAERMLMPARCDPSLSFETSKLSDVATLWHRAAENGLPPRSAFNPRTLKDVLPNVILADRIEDGDKPRYRFRLMGTVVSELLGDHTGKFIDEAVISPFRERWSTVLESGNRAACPLRIFGRLEYRQQDYIAMELLVAPLGSRIGEADAILVIACPSYSARHVFHPLVKNKLAAPDAAAL